MKIQNGNLSIKLHTSLSFSLFVKEDSSKPLVEGKAIFNLSEGQPSGEEIITFVQYAKPVETALGMAKRVDIIQTSDCLEITMQVDQYAQWPDCFMVQWFVRNIGQTDLTLDGMIAPRLVFSPTLAADAWTMQGIATNWGQDFAFKVPHPFKRENYLGHTDNGEGGGIPLLYAWNQACGLALAHLEPTQALWYMPVSTEYENSLQFSLENRELVSLSAGEQTSSLAVLISYHQGDFYAPLALYRELMEKQGLISPTPNAEDYQPAWCSWGYEFDVHPEEMIGVLPKLHEMNIRWLTLDDRWFDHYGDWNPRLDTFPGGEAQLKDMVDQIHAQKAFAQLWWYPLCVEDGEGNWENVPYGVSKILEQHPDWLVQHQDGSMARNNRGLAILCPALEEVKTYTLALTRLFIEDWGFDGHKLDNIYTVPPCYNPAHHHQNPQKSVDAFAELYRSIFELTRQLKPYSVTQICPCGTQITHTLIPAMDQAVTADPTSSYQIRQRIKFYKALLGPSSAVFADHVELSDGGVDFASEIGAGGIPATKFLWPEDEAIRPRLQEWWGLDSQKDAQWKKWFEIYARHSLADGETLNLYDIALDKPETHVIRKDDRLYFAFFTDEPGGVFSGVITLRGLEEKEYRLFDYVNEKELGQVKGPKGTLEINFTHALLIWAQP